VARGLWVTGAATPGDTAGRQQVARVMHRILGTVRPTGNALGPPGGPPTMVLLGKGGSGALWGCRFPSRSSRPVSTEAERVQ
jgi:hypothetical protein